MAPGQFPRGPCQELGHACMRGPSAQAHCCLGMLTPPRPPLAPWGAVCEPTSPQTLVTRCFQ
eukprot:6457786-Pyramimonas_sp.AAC.1